MKFTREELHLIEIALEELAHSDKHTIEDLEREGLSSLSNTYTKEIISAYKLLDKVYNSLYNTNEN